MHNTFLCLFFVGKLEALRALLEGKTKVRHMVDPRTLSIACLGNMRVLLSRE